MKDIFCDSFGLHLMFDEGIVQMFCRSDACLKKGLELATNISSLSLVRLMGRDAKARLKDKQCRNFGECITWIRRWRGEGPYLINMAINFIL